MLSPFTIATRSVHSRRQILRSGVGYSPYFHRNPLPKKVLSCPDLLTTCKAKYAAYNINPENNLKKLSTPHDGRPLHKITKYTNGYVPPPPSLLPPHQTPDGPTFRVPRSKKTRGMGFYKIYTSYTNQSSRAFTEIRVLGNVVDFCTAFEAMVVNFGERERYLSASTGKPDFISDPEWAKQKMKAVKGRPEWLVDVKPGSDGEFKVKVRGRWKKEIEEWIWGMGM